MRKETQGNKNEEEEMERRTSEETKELKECVYLIKRRLVLFVEPPSTLLFSLANKTQATHTQYKLKKLTKCGFSILPKLLKLFDYFLYVRTYNTLHFHRIRLLSHAPS